MMMRVCDEGGGTGGVGVVGLFMRSRGIARPEACALEAGPLAPKSGPLAPKSGPLASLPLLRPASCLLDPTEPFLDLALDALETVVDSRVKGLLDGVVQDLDDLRTEGRKKVLEGWRDADALLESRKVIVRSSIRRHGVSVCG